MLAGRKSTAVGPLEAGLERKEQRPGGEQEATRNGDDPLAVEVGEPTADRGCECGHQRSGVRATPARRIE
jgi:hypothetical protein